MMQGAATAGLSNLEAARSRSLEAAGGRPRGDWTFFDWRATGLTIAGRVRQLAERHPQRLAVFDVEARLTYRTLDSAANRVANALLAARGPRPEAVMLLFGVGAGAIVAALGVARAGKHFVAVEPSFPLPRVRQIGENAAVTTILTDTAHLPLARDVAGDRSTLVDIGAAEAGDDSAPGIVIAPDSIALLNYTSGSTGRPKGVVQTHRSAIAQASRFGNSFRLGDADRLASFGSLAWSGSVWDAFGALCMGASVGAYDVRTLGVHNVASWLEHEQVSLFSGMTVARRLAFDFAGLRFPGVRLVSLGGDTVYRRDVLSFQRLFPNAIMAVGLGTTEAGRIAEQYVAPGTVPSHEVVPVGFATPGVHLSLVGDDGGEVAPGDTGEIVVQSDELAAGYWNLPEVTAARFRLDPADPCGRRYFTGDLGRTLPGGMLQHAGRKDFELKIHGYPVAANEVEALLLEIEGVREACVVVQPATDGNEQLVAFLVRAGAATMSTRAIRDRLLQALPAHMVPRTLVEIDALPKTATGKTDRKAMPRAGVSHRDLDTPFIAPRTALEADVAAIWSDVLDIDAVGVEDDFLALGGDSLHAARIANQMFSRFGLDLALGALLAQPTVAMMAALVASTGEAGRTAASPIPRGRR
jgi:amino acid adenylation domain-containing protein